MWATECTECDANFECTDEIVTVARSPQAAAGAEQLPLAEEVERRELAQVLNELLLTEALGAERVLDEAQRPARVLVHLLHALRRHGRTCSRRGCGRARRRRLLRVVLRVRRTLPVGVALELLIAQPVVTSSTQYEKRLHCK